jgi:HK97 family phage portal protein
VGLVSTITQQLLRPFQRAAEGEPRPGPWQVTNPDGWLPNEWGKYLNYWQMGYDPISGGSSAVVEACVAAYAQTIAMCPGDHWKTEEDGGRKRVETSALSRILRKPNDYQSRSDFILNLVHDLYLNGNTYALAERNSRFEVTALHPFNPRMSRPYVQPGTTEIFYQLGGNNVIESSLMKSERYTDPSVGLLVVPARDVLHVKLAAKPSYPLIGVPPLRHAEAAVAVQGAIGSQLINFFHNMSRPSGVLATDLTLTKEQVDELRGRWNEQSKGLNVGGVPILTAGLKFQPMGMSAKDAELAQALKLTQDEIFMVYGVPPAILGMTDKGMIGSSTESLMQFWLATGLGFAINHVETAYDQFFGLRGYPYEYVEFDTAALLRVAYKERIDGLAKAVQGGIFSPNDARRSEALPDAEYGREPRVQQQVVPLSAWYKPPPKTAAAPAAQPAAPPANPDAAAPPPPEKQTNINVVIQADQRTQTIEIDGALPRAKDIVKRLESIADESASSA